MNNKKNPIGRYFSKNFNQKILHCNGNYDAHLVKL